MTFLDPPEYDEDYELDVREGMEQEDGEEGDCYTPDKEAPGQLYDVSDAMDKAFEKWHNSLDSED